MSAEKKLTHAQCLSVLEHIAGRTKTMRDLLAQIQVNPGGLSYAGGVLLDAAEALAGNIGAMADEASGSGIYGDADLWYYGPVFESL